ELAEITPEGGRGGGVGRAELDQKNACGHVDPQESHHGIHGKHGKKKGGEKSNQNMPTGTVIRRGSVQLCLFCLSLLSSSSVFFPCFPCIPWWLTSSCTRGLPGASPSR